MAFIDVLLKAEGVFGQVSSYLNTIVVALVIILTGFIIGKIIESALRVLFARIDLDERLTKAFGARRNYARAIRRTIVRIIYIVTVIFALQRLSLVKPVFAMIMFLAVIVILISIVLAGIDVIPNIAARVSLRNKKIIVGDEIVFADSTGVLQGRIIDITLTDVRIRRRNGDVFFIPNSVFLRHIITKKRKAP